MCGLFVETPAADVVSDGAEDSAQGFFLAFANRGEYCQRSRRTHCDLLALPAARCIRLANIGIEGVERLELRGSNRVTIGPVAVVRDHVVPRFVMGDALFRLYGTGRARPLGPDGRCLHVRTLADLAVSARERVSINGIHVAVIVDDPVTRFRALLGAPLTIDEAVCVK